MRVQLSSPGVCSIATAEPPLEGLPETPLFPDPTTISSGGIGATNIATPSGLAAFAPSAAHALQSGGLGTTSLAGKKILVVDDQRCVLEMLVSLLESWGMVVEATTHSGEALNHLMTRTYDLFMTDLVMPEPNGVELLNVMITRDRFIPTLILSGSQGNRQASGLLMDLSGEDFEVQNIPLAYMKKDVGDIFETSLRKRLLSLARRPPYVREVVEKRIPQFRDLIAVELDGGEDWTRDARKLSLITSSVNDILDLRFALYNYARPIIKEVRDWVASQGEKDKDRVLKTLDRILEFPPHTRDQILSFNQFQWHTFKNEGLYFRNEASGILSFLEDNRAPESLRKKMKWLFHLGTAFARTVYCTAELRKIGPTEVTCPANDVLVKRQSDFNLVVRQYGFENIGTDFSNESLGINVPGIMLYETLKQLLYNACQAAPQTPIALHACPMVRTRIVENSPYEEALLVKPPGGIEPPPLVYGQRYFYAGIVNEGPEIPLDVQERMRQGIKVTTKEFGTGIGLTFIHEHLKHLGGFLIVACHDGQTEVGVLIPLKKHRCQAPVLKG